jgi:hypothetical protein
MTCLHLRRVSHNFVNVFPRYSRRCICPSAHDRETSEVRRLVFRASVRAVVSLLFDCSWIVRMEGNCEKRMNSGEKLTRHASSPSF